MSAAGTVPSSLSTRDTAGGNGSTRALIALGLAGVLLGVLVGWLWWSGQRLGEVATARQNALHSAREQVAAELAEPATQVNLLAAGVVRAEPDQVVVLLFVNLATQGSQSGTVRLSAHRVELTMTRAENRWRVSGLERV